MVKVTRVEIGVSGKDKEVIVPDDILEDIAEDEQIEAEEETREYLMDRYIERAEEEFGPEYPDPGY